MKSMKFVTVLIILFGFSQCGGSTFVKNPPFKVEKAFYNKWVGGQPGASGIKLEMHLRNADRIIFDSLYFQNKKTRVVLRSLGDTLQLIGHYSTSKRKNSNFILDVDVKKEFQNAPPITENFPFDLKYNEAILSYKKGKKIVFFKIENIKKVQSIPFPTINNK